MVNLQNMPSAFHIFNRLTALYSMYRFAYHTFLQKPVDNIVKKLDFNSEPTPALFYYKNGIVVLEILLKVFMWKRIGLWNRPNVCVSFALIVKKAVGSLFNASSDVLSGAYTKEHIYMNLLLTSSWSFIAQVGQLLHFNHYYESWKFT